MLRSFLLLGISFWIAIICTQTELDEIENELKKKIMKAGLDVTSCKPINPRGMIFFSFHVPSMHGTLFWRPSNILSTSERFMDVKTTLK